MVILQLAKKTQVKDKDEKILWFYSNVERSLTLLPTKHSIKFTFSIKKKKIKIAKNNNNISNKISQKFEKSKIYTDFITISQR